MQRPLDGRPPVSFADYRRAPKAWHAWGVVGGAIWCTGAILNFLASRAHIVGPAVSYSIGQGATMVSASWGVFVWHEFSSGATPARQTSAYLDVHSLHPRPDGGGARPGLMKSADRAYSCVVGP
jgi:glucose uptake protein